MRVTLFGSLLVLVVAGGCSHSQKDGIPFDQATYEAERGKLAAIERAENEQAMRDYPKAGITAGMPRAERERLVQVEIQRQTKEALDKFSKVSEKFKQSIDETNRRYPTPAPQ